MIDLTNWAIIEKAPLTTSGQDETLYTARTKTDIIKIYRLFKLPTTQYEIIPLNYFESGHR